MKRVIGVAGDTIVCCDDQGRISVDDVPLDEPDLENDASCNGPMIGCHWSAGPVPAGHVFVMGDHRDDSETQRCTCAARARPSASRAMSTSPTLVVGKVFLLVWPLGHAGWVKRPATFAIDGG